MNRTVIREPTAEERETLGQWEHAGTIAWYQRAQIVLLAADARLDATAIARSLALHPNTTRRWLHTFDQEGLHLRGMQRGSGSPSSYFRRERHCAQRIGLGERKRGQRTRATSSSAMDRRYLR